MTEHLIQRIDAMFGRDKAWAYGFVILLWLTYAFVFFAVAALNSDSNVFWALVISGLLVVIYNTASIVAMVRHYAEDKHAIYSIDIRHLDEMSGVTAAERRAQAPAE